MDIWLRVLGILTVWGVIEGIDHLSTGINIPWWLSLLTAAFCSISDIIVILAIDLLAGSNEC